MRIEMIGEEMNNVIEAVLKYSEAEVESAVKEVAQESMEALEEATARYVGITEGLLDELEEREQEIEELQDEVCALVDDNMELMGEIASLRAELNKATKERQRYKSLVSELQEELGKHRVKSAMGDYYKYMGQPEKKKVEKSATPTREEEADKREEANPSEEVRAISLEEFVRAFAGLF